ncbi:YebC/PmpR family DNA-binding transcriptional regulator [bacterium]|nr:YebC/PmpR family DNA-binding transcriptional regulator [bacterium]|tara:strand:+ start:2088 stop:2798 length:711 start_codon:yes stop_codon:yes gene_type:complete
MSGHSKWSKIHRQKGVADNKRGALFTKLGKAITVAAKMGGGDPDSNFKLRLAIDKARAGSMPKDNIDRAIKRGTGDLEGGKIESITYEGFATDGIALMIETLTDNRNRTSSAIKHILSKFGGSLSGPNAVSWMFEPKGIIRIKEMNDELELELIDAGATDISTEEGGVTIYTQPNDLKKIKDILEQKNIEVEYAEVEQIPKEKKDVPEAQIGKLEKLFAELDENEDVNDFYTNSNV